MFSNRDLKNMIIPLFMEQFLVMLVGLADTLVISFVGEAAVSGVSLVNAFNTIFIYLFTALASGGAVVISQYVGRKNQGAAGESASQLLVVSVLFSVVIMVLILLFNEPLMRLMFGRVEADVMESCVIYLRISAYSYPALAIYNTGAALYRSCGKTSVTMYISVVSNIINVAGNLIGVFLLKAGVAGVAYPSLIARVFSAIVITFLCFSKTNAVRYDKQFLFKWNGNLQRCMLRIAVPNGLESGIFQLVKVALSSIVASFGTSQIAANGIAQSFWSMASLVCVAMGPVFITVIGQCMGAGDAQAAEAYFKKLMKITIIFAIVWNSLIFIVTPIAMYFYSLTDETKKLVIQLVIIHNIFNAVAFPFADPLGKGLRAAALLHVTQSTLSRQLMQMEEELGVKLFHRGKHNILLTEEGMLLRRRAQEIVDLAEKTEKELKHEEEAIAGEIAIGCGETQNMKPLSQMIASFQQRYPDVSFHIYTAIADDVKERLENGVLDMGLLLEPVEINRYHFVRMPLKERWGVLMRKDSPLAEKEKITPADLINVPLIVAKRQSVQNQLENWFGYDVGRLHIVSTCNLSHNNQSILVESGIGVAMVMEFPCNHDMLCLRPMEPELTNGCVLVWKKNQMFSPVMTQFIAHVKENMEDMEKEHRGLLH